jgi:hypothetical protein
MSGDQLDRFNVQRFKVFLGFFKEDDPLKAPAIP